MCISQVTGTLKWDCAIIFLWLGCAFIAATYYERLAKEAQCPPLPDKPVLSLKSPPPIDMLYGCSKLKSWCWVVDRDYTSWCWAAQLTTGGAIRQCSSDADCNPYDFCAGGSHEGGLERLEHWLESEHPLALAVYNKEKSIYDAALLHFESALRREDELFQSYPPFSREKILKFAAPIAFWLFCAISFAFGLLVVISVTVFVLAVLYALCKCVICFDKL